MATKVGQPAQRHPRALGSPGIVENARNITATDNLPLTIGHYLRNMGLLASQYFEKKDNYRDRNRQRIYLKDIDCPPVWHEKVKEQIPGGLFYLNESTGEIGGPGAVDEIIPNSSGRRKGKGIAPAGDLMSSLPPEMRAENLMCYIGHEGTYTPAHREMCASLGQNIMVEASGHVGDEGKPERPGSSVWFMTESKDRHMVAEYWLSVLGHDIEVEGHFAQVVAWQKAPFKTYVVEQKPGDFILIPPLAPHQVWNRGTRTMKVAWNRTTVETLEMALKEALPNARMVCRDEQYKNKAIIYYTLLKYSSLLRLARSQSYKGDHEAQAIRISKKVRQVQKDFKRLFELFKGIMLSEMFDTERPKEQCEFLAYDSNVTCAYCRGNIFNRFLSCKTCTRALDPALEEPYDVCMDCFAMGRSCSCQSNFKWVEQWKWKDLLQRYEEWRKQIIEIDNGVAAHLPLAEERRLYPKRTLAQVCQYQLKIRPWVDIKNPEPSVNEEGEEEEIHVDDNGNVKKIRKKNKAWLRDSASCHVCLSRHPLRKMAACTLCERYWCYSSLWRAHDLHPTAVMEDPQWECPHCRKVCNTGACRKDTRQRPYQPKGTMLGHDTRKVADVRSIESLVDFGASNLHWLGVLDVPGVNNPRMERRRQEAEAAKQSDPTLDDRYVLEDDYAGTGHIEYSPVQDTIDPALGGSSTNWATGTNGFVDPSLRLAEDSTADRAEANDDSQYAPPDSLRYREDDQDDSFMHYQYPDPDAMSQAHAQKSPTANNKKRPRQSDGGEIKLVPDKKQKLTKSLVTPKVNKATKQYQQEQEKKLIDEARRDGRYIVVYAQMHNKSRIVQLPVDGEKLREIISKPSKNYRPPPPKSATNGAGPRPNTVLISSDLAPQRNMTVPSPGLQQKKNVKQFKARVEEDEDFRIRERQQADGATKGKRKAPKVTYEEIEVASDGSDVDMLDVQGEVIRTGTSRRTRGEMDLTELPEDWKDGRVRRKRDREGEAERRAARRQTLPARPTAMKAPTIRPVRASTGNMDADADGDTDDDSIAVGPAATAAPSSGTPKRGRGRPPKSQHATPASARSTGSTFTAVNMAKSAAALLEQGNSNVNAKMQAAKWAMDGSSDLEPDDDEEPSPPRQVRPSIMSKGENVKIVGKNGVQKKAVVPPVVQISDDSESEEDESSSEDEIPARLPAHSVRGRT